MFKTDQETFDFIVNHLRKQQKKASNKNGSCKFRLEQNEEVLKCAVGCLIPDEMYDTIFEEQGGLTTEHPIWPVLEELGYHNYLLLKDFQVVHDSHQVLKWEERFRYIAAKYNLVYTSQTAIA